MPFWLFDVVTDVINDDHIRGASLRLWTAATNGPIVHTPSDNVRGEPWWNDDVDRVKLLTRPPELSGNPTNKVIW
jgi:hypothetical protein